MTETLVVKDLMLHVKRSAARSSIGITVERDGAVVVTAPVNCSIDLIEQFVENKLFWIYSKIEEKAVFVAKRRSREFVSGESFFYLGKPYRLLLRNEHEPAVLQFRQRQFFLSKYEVCRAKEHFVSWYIRHAQVWLWRRTNVYAERLGSNLEGVYVRDLDFRWGFCDKKRFIAFHWQLITLPPSIIDYIVVHELAHLVEHNHSDEFWRHVRRIIPNYLNHKRWLAENAVYYLL